MSIRPRALLRALVALATVGLASSALAATAGAGTASSKPTIVLVHGAFADSSGFTGVIDQLRRDGYPVRATPNRLLGLQSDAATVRGFLDSFKGPKILAGHSYGGAVITQAASGDSDVKALVYVAAFALDSNEVLGDLANRPVAQVLGTRAALRPVPMTVEVATRPCLALAVTLAADAKTHQRVGQRHQEGNTDKNTAGAEQARILGEDHQADADEAYGCREADPDRAGQRISLHRWRWSDWVGISRHLPGSPWPSLVLCDPRRGQPSR
jgi:pimeloyl-ACP methyl ester carboxylesterase